MNSVKDENQNTSIFIGCPESVDIEKLKTIYGVDDPRFKVEQSAWKRPLKWSNIIILSILHIVFIVCYVDVCISLVHIETAVFSIVIGAMSGIATSAGSHRLWSHRTFKAKWPLKLWLLIFQAITMNGSALTYARDHRTHHKYSDTDGDPKNPTRGLFYSHIGWWLVKKTESVKQAGRKLDFSDLYEDKLVFLQHKFYIPIFILFGMIIPTVIPVILWNEDPWSSFSICVILRIFVVLHHLFTVNSLAHYFGYRPYDFRILPADHRFVNYISFGEGLHNYHHVFPFDYRINDRPQWELFNPPGTFIHTCALLGLAYDLKIASPAVVKGVVSRRGVRALYDPIRSLKFRVMNAIFDWIFGISTALWLIYPALFFKLATQRVIYI
ncbi:delta(9)-fatty-acid desaturase fat-7 [Dermatophagoides farinae]|uniref:delta(9)-fatty-acid desaturase fat-7 n=1 Tax=Dermatophagoides farinae TaxID=6954 RepID=UPI003F61B547